MLNYCERGIGMGLWHRRNVRFQNMRLTSFECLSVSQCLWLVLYRSRERLDKWSSKGHWRCKCTDTTVACKSKVSLYWFCLSVRERSREVGQRHECRSGGRTVTIMYHIFMHIRMTSCRVSSLCVWCICRACGVAYSSLTFQCCTQQWKQHWKGRCGLGTRQYGVRVCSICVCVRCTCACVHVCKETGRVGYNMQEHVTAQSRCGMDDSKYSKHNFLFIRVL